MFDNLLFDLDGTLTDSFDGITNSVLYALKKMGEKLPAKEELRFFIGPPLSESFAVLFGGDTEKAELAVKNYREYYSVTGLLENRVYDGVEQTLKTLKDMGKRLFVATSKPEKFSVRIAEHFGLTKYIERVFGASFDSSRGTKDKVIEYALGEAGLIKDKTVMIGDRHHDIDGAKANGLKSVGVLYGYGNYDELSSAGADFIVETPEEIVEII